MDIGDIYNSEVDPDPRIEIHAGGLLHIVPLDEAKQFAAELTTRIAEREMKQRGQTPPKQEYKPESTKNLPPCPSCGGGDESLSSGHYTGDSSGLFYAAIGCRAQGCEADASVLGNTEAEAVEKILRVWSGGKAESKPESSPAEAASKLTRVKEVEPTPQPQPTINQYSPDSPSPPSETLMEMLGSDAGEKLRLRLRWQDWDNVHEVLAGNTITEEIAMSLETAFGKPTANFWLNRQRLYDLAIKKEVETVPKPPKDLYEEFSTLTNDTQRWEWILANQGGDFTFYPDNDTTTIVFEFGDSGGEVNLDKYISGPGLKVLLDAMNINIGEI